MKHFAGSDPGDRNYGYSVIDAGVSRQRLIVTIKEIGMFTCQINNLTNKPAKPPKSRRRKTKPILYAPFPEQYDLFFDEWENLVSGYQVVRTTTERFQARGLRGKSIEAVSIMNGAICSVSKSLKTEFEMITAATWKNQVNRYTKLDDVYKVCSITPHSVDSCFIAIYGALQHYKLPWTAVSLKAVINQLKQWED